MNTHTCNKLRQLHDPVLEQQLPQAAAKTLTRTRSVCRDGGQVKKQDRTGRSRAGGKEGNGIQTQVSSSQTQISTSWHRVPLELHKEFCECAIYRAVIFLPCLSPSCYSTALLRKCRSYVFNAPSELSMVDVPVWSRFWIQKQMKAIGWVAMHHHAIAEGILAKNSNLHFSIDFDFLLGYALLHGLMTPAGCICVWSLDYRMKAAFSIAVEPCAASPHQSSHQRRFLKAYF